MLHGVTGSGKTRIYLERTLSTIAAGKSVVVLTPEIGLTQPLIKQFEQHIPAEVFGVHSDMTQAARRKRWLQIATSPKPLVVIGPRSALFMPTTNIGLIIIDEAHDSAYKQDQSPHYLATRVAAKLRSLHNAQLILGSATPSVADYYTFSTRGLPIVSLQEQAVKSDTRKKVVIIDSKNRGQFSRSRILSDQLLDAIQESKSRGEQSLLFLNKRGSARLILCQSCGWQAICPRCDVSLTFHADTHNLRCHSCDTTQAVPLNCPECDNHEIVFTSVGTKALEQEISRLFPQSRVQRFDGDTTKSQSLSALASDLQDGSIDIIIGTQTITKGFDLPNLGVVGIVQADTSMAIADFSASEKTFQLLTQTSGRIGRGHRNSTLVIQSFNPDSPVLKQAVEENYVDFYASEIAERRTYNFPPFKHMMVIRCTRSSRASALAACKSLKLQIRISHPHIQIDGPSPRFIEKQRGKYTWQLLLRSTHRNLLVSVAQNIETRFSHNIDPIDLL
jgi:primosomal protein N' (replication factor Y)